MTAPADVVKRPSGGNDDGFEIVVADESDFFPDDEPPSYIPSDASLPPQSPSPSTPFLRPINMLAITQDSSDIKGTFIIDPALIIPKSILPALSSGEERVNAFLHTGNGIVDADIRVLPTSGSPRPLGPRTSVIVSSQNWSLTVRIQRPDGEPVSLSTRSRNGKTTVYLPRSFNGPVTMYTPNSVVIPSEALIPSTTVFSETSDSKKWFIGDLVDSKWSADSAHWLGDELHIDSNNGKVRLMYADEEELSSQPDGPYKSSKDNTSSSVGGQTWSEWGMGLREKLISPFRLPSTPLFHISFAYQRSVERPGYYTTNDSEVSFRLG